MKQHLKEVSKQIRKCIRDKKRSKRQEKLQNTLKDSRADDEEKNNGEGDNEEIPLITAEEIQAAINKLKKGKASDNNGIHAEDIKTCDNECPQAPPARSSQPSGYLREEARS